jgi:hypothetical protein
MYRTLQFTIVTHHQLFFITINKKKKKTQVLDLPIQSLTKQIEVYILGKVYFIIYMFRNTAKK